MMMHGMGGGIGTTMIMGWPLADWATIMLLLIVSVMVVAIVSAVLSALTPWLTADGDRAGVSTTEGLTKQPNSDCEKQLQNKGTQDA